MDTFRLVKIGFFRLYRLNLRQTGHSRDRACRRHIRNVEETSNSPPAELTIRKDIHSRGIPAADRRDSSGNAQWAPAFGKYAGKYTRNSRFAARHSACAPDGWPRVILRLAACETKRNQNRNNAGRLPGGPGRIIPMFYLAGYPSASLRI